MPTHVNWDNVEKGKNVKIGNVGVDSATVKLGDGVLNDQLEIFTPEGDGGYPVFARTINGRKCLVIDFDLIDYGTGEIYYNEGELSPDSENFKGSIIGEAFRLCPKCNCRIVQENSGPGYSWIKCENGHETLYKRKKFDKYIDNYKE